MGEYQAMFLKADVSIRLSSVASIEIVEKLDFGVGELG
jgi:hypothetical protein